MKSSFLTKTLAASFLAISFTSSLLWAEDSEHEKSEEHNAPHATDKSTNKDRGRMSDEETSNINEAKAQKDILQESKNAYSTLLDKTGIPRDLLKKADCVAVIPNVKTRALLVGTQGGEGVISCKTGDQGWSDPAFIELSKKSLGAQAGMDSKDMVFFIVGKDQAQKFIDGSLTFGSDLSITAGPVAKGVDQNFKINSGIYSYASEEHGAFAGLSLSGANVSLNEKHNQAYYGKNITPKEGLSLNESSKAGQAAKGFKAALPTS